MVVFKPLLYFKSFFESLKKKHRKNNRVLGISQKNPSKSMIDGNQKKRLKVTYNGHD